MPVNDPLKEVKDVLVDLNTRLHNMEKLWSELSNLNPHLDSSLQKDWLVKQRRCWLHGATYYQEAAVLFK